MNDTNTENQKIKQGNINDLVNIINKANDTFAYEVFIPSLDRAVSFREINTAQQKKLVKSIIDSPIFHTEFIFTLRSIIGENCVDGDVDIDELTIYDKLLIALNMRIYSVGDELTLSMTCDDCEKTHPVNIHLHKLLEETKNINIEYSKVIEDETQTFKVHCELPTILTEYRLENEFRKNTKLEVEGEEEIRETIGNVFISEIVKYVSRIDVVNKEDGKIIELDLRSMTFSDRIKLIEKLNVKILTQIVDYIASIKKEFDKIYMVKMVCDCENKTPLEQRFSIDSNFFIVS